MPPYEVDALTDASPPGTLWTRVNSGEAVPGVMTPVTWAYYGRALELGGRQGFADLGVIPRSVVPYPADPGERLLGIFHGRLTVNVDVARRFFAGLPGVSGDDVERDMFGSAREGVVDEPYPWRTAAVLAKAPMWLAVSRAKPREVLEANRRLWTEAVVPEGVRDGVDPRWVLREALKRFSAVCRLQAWLRLLVQGVSGQALALAQLAGAPEAAGALMAGSAQTEEAAVADELWLVAHDRLALAEFLARHGFHGPNSGEVSSRSWRENAQPLERLLATIRESEPPAERRARTAAESAKVAARVLRALPAARRPGALLVLRAAPLVTRSIERTKTSFLLLGDMGRAAVRTAGAQLAGAGRLEDPEDAFHLFPEELFVAHEQDLRELVAQRRALRAQCLEVEIPETWVGQPQPIRKSTAHPGAEVSRVTGLGASPGVAEGRVRIVLDAADDVEVELGDILVCPTTDPSWLAMMTVAGALVIDIGAATSHGAIVARELGVPCVIGTRTGTTALRDGDRVRVDGSAGVVEIVARKR